MEEIKVLNVEARELEERIAENRRCWKVHYPAAHL